MWGWRAACLGAASVMELSGGSAKKPPQLEVLGDFKGKDGGIPDGDPKHYMELIFLLTSLTPGQNLECF